MSSCQSEAGNITLHESRENQRLGKTRPRFASELLGSALGATETALRKARDEAATTYSNTHKKPLKEQGSLVHDTTAFNQDFAWHRDFKTRYASTPALRRRGLASARQRHFLGRVFHRYADPQTT